MLRTGGRPDLANARADHDDLQALDLPTVERPLQGDDLSHLGHPSGDEPDLVLQCAHDGNRHSPALLETGRPAAIGTRRAAAGSMPEAGTWCQCIWCADSQRVAATG